MLITRFYKILYKNTETVYIGVTTRPINKRFSQHIHSKGLNPKIYTCVEFDRIEHNDIKNLEDYYNEKRKVVELERKYIREEKIKGSKLLNISIGGEWGSAIINNLYKEYFFNKYKTYNGYLEYKRRKIFIQKVISRWIEKYTINKTKKLLYVWTHVCMSNKTLLMLRIWVRNKTINKSQLLIKSWIHCRTLNRTQLLIRTWVAKIVKNKTYKLLRRWVLVRKNNKVKEIFYHWVRNQMRNKTHLLLQNWCSNRIKSRTKRLIQTWFYNRSLNKTLLLLKIWRLNRSRNKTKYLIWNWIRLRQYPNFNDIRKMQKINRKD